VALVVSIAALVATAVTLYHLWRSTKASEAAAKAAESSAKASEVSAGSSIVSARAAEDSVTVAKGLLKIEQDREYARTRPKLSGLLVPEPSITGTNTNAWLEVHLNASTPEPLRKLLLTVPTGAWFGRGGMSSPSLMRSDLGFPGEPGQVAPIRPGRPARWRVNRADSAHGTVTATAICTSEDGTVWEDVEVPISQDYEDSGPASS
jgi:hypothetical protein